MKTIKQVRREAKLLFSLCQVNDSLDQDRVHKVVQQILANKRRGYLALVSQFMRLVRLEQLRQTRPGLSDGKRITIGSKYQ